MTRKQGRLSYIQYSSLIISTMIGVIVVRLPKLAAVSAEEGAVYSALISGVLTIVIAVAMAILGKRFHNQTIMEYSTLILGKVLGKLFGALVTFYFIIGASVVLRDFSDALKGLLLKNTPLEIIMISMLLTVVYMVTNGINSVAKVTELFLPIIILSLALVIVLSGSNFKFVNLRPTLIPNFRLIIKGIPDLVIAFQGYEIILLVIPFLNDHKKVIPYTIIGTGIPTILYTILVAMTIGVFGLETTQNLNYPTISLAEGITFPGAFAERFDIFIAVLWILAAFTTIGNLFYMFSFTTVRLFGLKHYKPFVYILAPIVYILAILPQNLMEIRRFSSITGYIGLGVSIIIVGMLFLAWISGGKRERKNA